MHWRLRLPKVRAECKGTEERGEDAYCSLVLKLNECVEMEAGVEPVGLASGIWARESTHQNRVAVEQLAVHQGLEIYNSRGITEPHQRYL